MTSTNSSARWASAIAAAWALAHCQSKPATCERHDQCVRVRTVAQSASANADADAGADAAAAQREQLGFCAATGVCMRECERDRDCPCGAYCATGCGVCLRAHDNGPATCATRALSEGEVMGLCRDDITAWSSLASSDLRKQQTLQCPDAGIPTCNGYVGGRIEFPQPDAAAVEDASAASDSAAIGDASDANDSASAADASAADANADADADAEGGAP